MFCRPQMKELLQAGTTLVVDRYSYSGVAFSAAKQVSTAPVYAHDYFNWDKVATGLKIRESQWEKFVMKNKQG